MKSVVAAAAALAMFTSAVTACPFMRSAEDHTMSVASLDTTNLPMSTSEDVLAEQSIDEEITTGAIEADQPETEISE